MTGLVCGEWTVICLHSITNRVVRWMCRCTCGTERPVIGSQLRNGNSSGCGCTKREAARIRCQARLIDRRGQKFGRLTVVERAICEKRGTHWKCLCDCGATTIVASSSLTCGLTRSCGCLQRETAGAACVTHGLSGTPEYVAFHNMHLRCYNPDASCYDRYGGRGIKVCRRWHGANGLSNFIADMGTRPGPNYELDRENTNGNYTPKNCRWVPRIVNKRNKENTILLTHNGETLSLMEWSERSGIHWSTLRYRFKKGWSSDKVLSTENCRTSRQVLS